MNWVIGIIIDIVLLFVVILCARKGHKDGFAKTLVSFMGFFIALVVATTVCTPLANLTYNTCVAKSVESTAKNFVDDKLEEYGSIDEQAVTQAVNSGLGTLPKFLLKGDGSFVAETINNILEKHDPKVDTQEIAHQFSETVVRPMLVPTISAVCFAVIFIVILIACKILSKALKLVNKLPLLGGVNAFLGGLLGFLKGIILVLIINWAFVLVVGDNGSLFSIITPEAVQCSLINKYLSIINPINILFNSISPFKA